MRRALVDVNSKETCQSTIPEMPFLEFLDFGQILAFLTVTDGAPSAYNNLVPPSV